MDATVLRWSKGKYTLTTMLAGLPVVVLTTTGAKSGQPRSIPLAGIPDGEKIILIPSSFGSPHYPAWYYNLRANPQVEISLHGQSRKYIAHIRDYSEGEKYWRLALYYYPGFQAYQQRSGGREIRIVVLEPVP